MGFTDDERAIVENFKHDHTIPLHRRKAVLSVINRLANQTSESALSSPPPDVAALVGHVKHCKDCIRNEAIWREDCRCAVARALAPRTYPPDVAAMAIEAARRFAGGCCIGATPADMCGGCLVSTLARAVLAGAPGGGKDGGK